MKNSVFHLFYESKDDIMGTKLYIENTKCIEKKKNKNFWGILENKIEINFVRQQLSKNSAFCGSRKNRIMEK